MMKPILFNTEMVRAILDGRKTVTRRLVKPQPKFREGETGTPERCDDWHWCFKIDQYNNIYDFDLKPPCDPGDILYVRETWCDPTGTGWPIVYKADMPLHWDADQTEHGEPVDIAEADFKWKPSIHMPKEYARIFLRVKDVRVERLQEIDEVQAQREGCYAGPIIIGSDLWAEARVSFPALWDSTIKSGTDREIYGWDANPWVWVIEFEKISRENAWEEGR